MPDPVTIGGLAASLLAMAATEALKTGVGEAVKDAYAKLKTKIAGWAGRRRRGASERAGVPGRQLTVAETINRQSPSDLAEVRTLALALNEALSGSRKIRRGRHRHRATGGGAGSPAGNQRLRGRRLSSK